MQVQFDETQRRARDEALAFLTLKDRPSYRIGGYAGTGKTTIAKAIIADSGLRCKPCAFAGKAAHVLRKKGVSNAETIHRTIYEWDEHNEKFIRREAIPADFILVDEGSMVPVYLWDDLLVYRLPIIVVGDPGQLEPVGEDAYLMHKPDIVLNTIHRYDDVIALAANYVRMNGDYPKTDGSFEFSVATKNEFTSYVLNQKPDVILCALNKTRVAMNAWLRGELRVGPMQINPGEKLICLHNDRNLSVFNGLTMVVDKVHSATVTSTVADVTCDDGRGIHNVTLSHCNLYKAEKLDWRSFPKNQCIVDYAYALTVHKFQGSEADHVAVFDEQPATSGRTWDVGRWRYTAITRTSERVKVFA